MRNIRLTIQYDGTRYQGWQRLSENRNTIQEKIESVLSTLVGEEVHLVGSGRTDSGVHAERQTANFLTRSSVPCDEILEHCSRFLPQDIVVREAEEAARDFHSRFHAKEKTYRYTIDNGHRQDVFSRKYALHLPQRLDVDTMRETAQLFIGQHDFRSFTKLHSKTKSTVRTLFNIEIDEKYPFIFIRISGNGFLYKMVRLISGALIEAGRHQLSAIQIKEILQKKDKNNPIEPAPPHGLRLEDVSY